MRVRVIASILGVAAVWATFPAAASAHPGSGIVVDGQGQVFFQDSAGRAIWKIDAAGKLTKFCDKVGGHWMALDAEGRFARTDLKRFKRVTPVGAKPALIVAEGGAPIVVNNDGNLYYGLSLLGGHKIAVGLTRISPDGKQKLFAPALKETVEKLGISGLATGSDGSLYLACNSAVLKVEMDGTFNKVASPVEVKDCDVDFPDNDPTFPMPALRGIAVDSRGTVYAAATGCHRVMKLTPDGKVETVLKAERPWAPTGVAVSGEDIYVLEYTNATAGADKGWRPRVRKLGRDGKVTTLATIPENEPQRRPK
ncbi:MAG TPA: SMP-30/gluconolactonase/LRE family protein [Planctomycetaceae bacterium]|jgi:sugar lactone lactonase YvrE|nr:SMP-30/gluconolactonase/LRE family protein [Planctomycetaceae bacterium]